MMRFSIVPVSLAAVAFVAAQDLPPTKRTPPPSPNAAANVTYRDATDAAGLSRFTHVSGRAEKDYIIEVTGSGVATWDFDNDGLVDIYLVNGSTLERVRKNEPGPPSALFRNNGNGTYTDVTSTAGVANARWGQGVCVGDFDNDGDSDFYVTNFHGANRLYRNEQGRQFTDVATKAGVATEGWSTGCAFGDFDGDGWLDLFVAEYITLDLNNLPPAGSGGPASTTTSPATDAAQAPAGDAARMGASYSPGATICTHRGIRVMCGPRGLKGAPDHLYRNNGDGTFTDVTKSAGVADAKRLYGFGVGWFDMDDDGRLDLFVANDTGPNYLYRNLGNGHFEDVSYPSGAALDGQGREQAHMGLAIGDYDNDGRSDVHITNFANDFNVLYHNDDGTMFSDVSAAMALLLPTTPYLGWGTNFLDYDNDGWLDLLVVNGHIYPIADRMPWNTSYAQRALLFRNLAGRRFEDVGAAAGDALNTPRSSRGSAVADLDNDGGLDIVINNIDARPTLAHNEGAATAGHWLTVRLVGDPARKCPRDAIGSTVFVTAGGVRRRQDVASGRSQISQSDLRVHFGLGRERRVSKLEVRWANGPTVTYPIDRVDAIVTIHQADGALRHQN